MGSSIYFHDEDYEPTTYDDVCRPCCECFEENVYNNMISYEDISKTYDNFTDSVGKGFSKLKRKVLCSGDSSDSTTEYVSAESDVDYGKIVTFDGEEDKGEPKEEQETAMNSNSNSLEAQWVGSWILFW